MALSFRMPALCRHQELWELWVSMLSKSQTHQLLLMTAEQQRGVKTDATGARMAPPAAGVRLGFSLKPDPASAAGAHAAPAT